MGKSKLLVVDRPLLGHRIKMVMGGKMTDPDAMQVPKCGA